MNPIIFILLCFAALGLFDKMFKNRLGLATSFDRGIITMGDFMMSVGGFYCIAIAFLNGHATLFENKEMESKLVKAKAALRIKTLGFCES